MQVIGVILAVLWGMGCILMIISKFIPIDHKGHRKAGLSKSDKKDYHGAISHYTKAIKELELSVRAGTIKDTSLLTELYSLRSSAEIAAGKYQEALSDCDKVLIEAPFFAEAYLNRATAKIELNDFHGAIIDSSTALEMGINRGAGFFVRSIAYSRSGEKDMAERDLLLAKKNGYTSWLTRHMLRQ